MVEEILMSGRWRLAQGEKRHTQEQVGRIRDFLEEMVVLHPMRALNMNMEHCLDDSVSYVSGHGLEALV